MAAFTEITNGFAPQLNMAEIVNAANERRLAAIASGATGLPGAIPTASPQSFQGGTVKPTHLLIQEMLEALATSYRYVDHDATTPVDTPYTLTTFRTRAGLNSSGFRRASTWANPDAAPSFSYGHIQTGDIAGYWIWEDIVKGLKALKWTRKGVTFEGKQSRYGQGKGANAVADADASWNAASWETATSELRTCWMVFSGPQYTPRADILVNRSKHKVLLSAAAPVNVSAEFWSYITLYTVDRFFDLESYSEDTWILFETVAIAASGTNAVMEDYNMVANPMSNPMSTAGIGPAADSAGSTCSKNWAMLKWNFSHS